jgi:hypothetical protein
VLHSSLAAFAAASGLETISVGVGTAMTLVFSILELRWRRCNDFLKPLLDVHPSTEPRASTT